MKRSLTLAIALLISILNAQGAEKCYEPARSAAIRYAIAEDIIIDASQFTSEFGDEVSETGADHATWHKEYHSFFNTSNGIVVEIDYVHDRCFVKKTTWFQNDQDQD